MHEGGYVLVTINKTTKTNGLVMLLNNINTSLCLQHDNKVYTYL